VSPPWRSSGDPGALTGFPPYAWGLMVPPVSATEEIALEELPEDQRLTVREAAEMLGRSVKATEQLVSRGVLRVARERDENGRTRRVWTSMAALEEYVRLYARGRVELPKPVKPEAPVRRAELGPMPPELRQKLDRAVGRSPEQRVIEDLSRENTELRLRVAELEQELEKLRS
jgi:hypothetical protein